MKTLFEVLTIADSTLEELEARIEAGLKTFVDVGNCLLYIRDKRLYKQQGYTRFEDYCQERWGWTKTHVNRQIEAAKTIEVLTPTGVIPETERQARELAPLVKADEKEAIETWQQLREEHGDKLTAKIIKEAVVEKLKPAEEPAAVLADCLHEAEVKKLAPNKPHVVNNTGNNEWYTPAEYIEAARRVMGRINLDPATSEMANETVQANIYYDVECDGLNRRWFGKVWMNPPYAAELIGKFCDKLVLHYAAGDIEEAIVLVNNATETKWFNTLIHEAAAVVFPQGRVKFNSPTGEQAFPLQGQAVIYFGTNMDRFFDEFGSFGWGATV